MSMDASESRLDQSLLAVLERTRDRYGYLPDHALSGVADDLGLTLVEVYAAATFYRGLPRRRAGKHVIRMCKSIPCYLKGNNLVIEAAKEELGIGPGETSRDGLFSLEMVSCIGACDQAPAMMIDDRVHGSLTPDRVKAVLAAYRQAGS